MDLFFKANSFVLVPCPSARDAMTMARHTHPQLVLLDLHLPNIDDGRSVLAELRRDPQTRDIPVIVASADQRGLQRYSDELRSGSAAQLVKPFDLEQLLTVMRLAIEPDPAIIDASEARTQRSAAEGRGRNANTEARLAREGTQGLGSPIIHHRYRLPNGREFVAAAEGDDMVLLTRRELRDGRPASHAVRPDGKITLNGFDTGWRVADLADLGRSTEPYG